MASMTRESIQALPERRHCLRHAMLLLGCLGALWLFMLQARVLATGWAVLVWGVVTLVMMRGLFRRARIRRRAWCSAYLHPESAWNRRLRGRWLMLGAQLLQAIILSAVLLITVVRAGSDPTFWRLLLLAVLLMVLARVVTERLFWRDASSLYRPELVARVGLWSAGAVMLTCLLLWSLVQPQPDFREATLDQVLWHVTDQEVAVSALVEAGARFLAGWQGAEQWVAQTLTAMDQPAWLRAGIWVSILLRQSLFVVSLLVLFNGALAGRLHDGSH